MPSDFSLGKKKNGRALSLYPLPTSATAVYYKNVKFCQWCIINAAFWLDELRLGYML